MLFATGLALLTSAFPPAERGRALGINTAFVCAGLSLGPVAGGLLTAQLGWRSIFAVNAIAGLALAGVMARRIGSEWRGGGARRRLDPAGALLYAVSLGALLLGTSALHSVSGAGRLLGFGAAGLLAFATIDQGTGLARVFVGLCLVGVGFGLFSSPNTNAVMSAVARRQYGVAAATLGTMRLVGRAASLALVALVLARFMGAAGVSPGTRPQLLLAMRASFAAFAAASAVGALASLARGRVRESS